MPAPLTPPDGPPGDRQNQGAGSAPPEVKPIAHEEPSVGESLAEASAIYPDTSPSGPTAAQIAAEAYAIYLHRGARHGEDVEHWLEAERILRARWTAAQATASPQTASPQRQESTRGEPPEDDAQRTVAPRASGLEAEGKPVSTPPLPSESVIPTRGTSLPDSAGQLAGSGQVQRREDPQAPKDVDPGIGLERGRREDAEGGAAGGAQEERSWAKADQPLRPTKNRKERR